MMYLLFLNIKIVFNNYFKAIYSLSIHLVQINRIDLSHVKINERAKCYRELRQFSVFLIKLFIQVRKIDEKYINKIKL